MSDRDEDARNGRAARLAEQLRANLKRRKAQARAAAAQDGPPLGDGEQPVSASPRRNDPA
ncbi:hypothetical protein COA17_06490 [Sphingomonas ginsenosidimutans]|jgi:hypothetical protein|uniref:Uncharacterized protein n=1 Tax=Sphingomonas ginsenosidimutans TaxID=862134 RepID=A0A2A4I0S1_9SPHN|nr:hypothetical protein COA17_06490 [Sphingomonas ginsenosidimutans]